jgi:hypothetical protein
MAQYSYVTEALALTRTRQSWNDRLEHWERPASESEEAMIDRAARAVRTVISRNAWCTAEGIQIEPQGSYYNNTNVRQESDIDLRATHPDVHIQYAANVVAAYAYQALGYRSTGKFFVDTASRLRSELIKDLSREFGATNVDASGKKAIKVKGVPGSRAPVDVVPCFRLHYVVWDGRQYWTIPGVSILDRNMSWTFSFPDQHHTNCVNKRARTQWRFKKIVRMSKRLRDELVEARALNANEVSSFLVESLMHGVEDAYFVVEQDDRYDRLLRIIGRMRQQVYDQRSSSAALEINGINSLFGIDSSRLVNAQKFADLALGRLLA